MAYKSYSFLDFTEMMRALSYPRLISMENFRTPNFELVAEILGWLVKRYDPNADMPSEIDTEQDRVIFIRSVAQFMLSKAGIKLNTKRLYQADGYAVKELLKISSILYNAMKSNALDMSSDDIGQDESNISNLNLDITSKISELKQCRQLASHITTRGAKMYDLLASEVDLRVGKIVLSNKTFLELYFLILGLGKSKRIECSFQSFEFCSSYAAAINDILMFLGKTLNSYFFSPPESRQQVIGKQLEIGEIEKSLRSSINNAEEAIKKKLEMIDNVAIDETNLEAKIEKKKAELERDEKRLQSLKSVRWRNDQIHKMLMLSAKASFERTEALASEDGIEDTLRPAYMDEYERLEKELEKHYEIYLTKFRCLTFLEQQLEEYENMEQEKTEYKKMMERLRYQEMMSTDNPDSLEDMGIADDDDIGERQILGSMVGEDTSQGSDSDLDLDGEDEDDDGSELGSDDIEMSNHQSDRINPSGHNSERRNSDNDF
ncbi:Clusterin-associated protein 1 [Nymphon striatum]|nr:Clusterin-associated protein 1 [Nymphon striatum]